MQAGRIMLTVLNVALAQAFGFCAADYFMIAGVNAVNDHAVVAFVFHAADRLATVLTRRKEEAI